ncbi:hypothetical protein HanRHA438_Chr14g0655651 [Helianthus annuus]|nr:hypothetical protein HanRHA438_Chr14g0655651 [Helianthus annuus]
MATVSYDSHVAYSGAVAPREEVSQGLRGPQGTVLQAIYWIFCVILYIGLV